MPIDPPHTTVHDRPQLTRSLRFNFSWVLIGNVVYGGCQWLMLVCIARLGNPQTVGTFALAQAIAAPIILFSNLQLRVVQATDSHERFQFGHYLAIRYLSSVVAFAMIFIWTLAGRYREDTLSVILIVAMAKSIESISDIYFGLLQHHEEMSRIAKSMIVKGLGSLAALGGTLYITHRLVFGVTAMMLVWLLLLAAYDSRAARFCALGDGRPVWDHRALSGLVRLAAPLGVTMMLISLNANLPRYFMQHYQGTRQLGLFSALATIQSAGMLVVMALGNAVLPRLARHYHNNDWRRFKQTFLFFLLIAGGLGAATLVPVLAAGDRLIGLVFGREYAGQNQTFIWLALAAAVSYLVSVFGYAATASRRLMFQPFACGAMTAVTALGCYCSVPRYGGLGAAITLCTATTVGLLLYLLSFTATARGLRSRAAKFAATEAVSEASLGPFFAKSASAVFD